MTNNDASLPNKPWESKEILKNISEKNKFY